MTTRSFFEYVSDQLSELSDVTFRPMMGEYIIYFKGKVVGGIYDDRLLLKPTEGVEKMLTEVKLELPYEGSKPMISVTDIDDKEFLTDLIEYTYNAIFSHK